MAASGYQREQDLFHTSLALGPEERRAYLRQACQTDLELLKRIERLLAAHAFAEEMTLSPMELQAGQLFAATLPPGAEGNTAPDADPCPGAGSVIGVWRLVHVIGEGGMASVWFAERCDGRAVPPVALKLPHGGWPRDLLQERIERERDLLRTLNHPNIARLLDAGVTSGGQPYLALEYVPGQRIDDYCRQHELSVSARLRAFLQVTDAISHAHRMLIVHRDIKPSNILVTQEGSVRVLDFGIAKLLEGGQTQETELTRYSGQVFTLEYASPEQVLAKPLTVASDVYSLGVVLYELLTDARTYQLKRCSRAALEEAVLTVEPRRPSEAVSSPRRRRALIGDIDTIVMKALKKDAADRYASVEEFADDIRCYLENRPVAARPDSCWYRFSKLVRRHYVVLAVAAVFVIAICATSAAIAWQARIAITQRQRAEAAKTVLMSMLFETHSYWGNGKPLSTVQFLQQMYSQAAPLAKADAETRVEILNILAASLLSQQDTSTAEAVAIRASSEAIRLSPDHRMALRARMLRSWVRLYRGQIGTLRNDIDRLVSDMKIAPSALPEDLAGTLRIRSAVACENGDAETAEAFASEALNTAEKRLGLWHNQSVLALVDLSYAYLLANKNQVALYAAERARQRALEAYHGSASHPNVVKARVAYAQALAANGRRDVGIRELRRAIDDSAELFGPSSRAVGLDLVKLARMELQGASPGTALEAANRAQSILKDHFDNTDIGFAGLLEVRGAALLAAHKRGLALRDLAEADQLLVRVFGPNHVRTLRVRALLNNLM
jgi:eukaryotic-like serine/threonine-protein kinase